MVGKVVTCTFVFGLSFGAIYAQQVEVPREKSGNVVSQTKRVAAQPVVEVNPLKIALVEPRKLTIEQMRKEVEEHRLKTAQQMKSAFGYIDYDSQSQP